MDGQDMTDYRELVKALRCGTNRADKNHNCEKCRYYSNGCLCTIAMDEAAAAIEELDAEETRLLLITSELQDKVMDLQAQLPKLGEWQKAKPKGVVTYSDGYAECSHCHEAIWLGWGMNFCPNCGTQNKIIDPDDYDGAKMEVQE